MTMNLYRIYSEPCGDLICTVACCSDSPDAALEMARQNAWACQQMGEDACAFPVEEGGGMVMCALSQGVA